MSGPLEVLQFFIGFIKPFLHNLSSVNYRSGTQVINRNTEHNPLIFHGHASKVSMLWPPCNIAPHIITDSPSCLTVDSQYATRQAFAGVFQTQTCLMVWNSVWVDPPDQMAFPPPYFWRCCAEFLCSSLGSIACCAKWFWNNRLIVNLSLVQFTLNNFWWYSLMKMAIIAINI